MHLPRRRIQAYHVTDLHPWYTELAHIRQGYRYLTANKSFTFIKGAGACYYVHRRY
jgi:hypothetical protein